MKYTNKIFSGVFLIGSFLLLQQIAFAVGTPAGTVIQSRSKVVYTTASGSVSDTVYSNIVSITVAQVAALNITPASNAATTTSDSVYVSYPLTITNSGNGTDQFILSSTSSKGWTRSFYFDANGNSVLDAAEITAGAIEQTPANIPADATFKIMVRVFVPRDASLNGTKDTTVVTATSVFSSTKNNTAKVITTVNTANIANIGTGLSVLPTDPMPGDTVTYSLTLTNTGSLSATSVLLTDLINASQFTLVSATTTLGSFSGASIPATWTVGTIPAGGSVTVTIRLKILPALPFGTVLNNTINATYTVGGNTFTVGSNNPPAAIGVVRGVQITPTALSVSKEREDTIFYGMRVKNTGNSSDVLELSYSSTKTLAWKLYRDISPFGAYNTGDILLTNTNVSPASIDVNTVATTDTVRILALAVVPVAASDQDQDITTFTVSSAADPAKSQGAIATTTYNVPVITLVRGVTPTGSKPPGEEMLFSITYQNIGNGKAYGVKFSENEPDSMTYVANSVTIDGVAKTDDADSDGVTVTTVEGRKVITFTLGLLNPGSPAGVIRYRATIN